MKKEKLGFNVILLGMIASGKDTQAKILTEKYSLKTVETGTYSRKLMQEKSADGDWARRTTGKGQPLPVPLLKKFLVKEVEMKPKGKGLLFVGGPRLKPEAQLLKKILESKHQDFIAFYITLADKRVYERSLKRKEENTTSIHSALDAKHLIAKRIKWHKDQVSKTVAYFEKLGKLTKINGNQPKEKVTEDIMKVIEGYKEKIRN